MRNHQSIKQMILTATFISIIVMMSLIPWLGLINFGFISITTLHIPVIIGSIILGFKRGALLGFVFGLMSFINNSWYNPGLLSFLFSPVHPVPFTTEPNFLSLLIVFVPRIILGILPSVSYNYVFKKLKNRTIVLIIVSILSTLMHTALVLGGILLIFKDIKVSDTLNITYQFTLSLVAANGIPEAILAAIVVTLVIIRIDPALEFKQIL